ncbi:unnamed protein product, partial [Phaeothamnion confervicola]
MCRHRDVMLSLQLLASPCLIRPATFLSLCSYFCGSLTLARPAVTGGSFYHCAFTPASPKWRPCICSLPPLLPGLTAMCSYFSGDSNCLSRPHGRSCRMLSQPALLLLFPPQLI